ncbi:MAG: DUF1329 domain-containing protein [Deltaproteobacteria bacterium]|nr:DUF1329 domain-containing protein [Deltaproteobacteria bacterium]
MMRRLFARSIALFLVMSLAQAGAGGAQATPEEVAPGLKLGDMLDQSNYQLAKELLPPELLKHYQTGEYRNRIVAYPTGNLHWEKAWEEASKQNVTQLDVDGRGTIIDKSTGKQPGYYYGIPFPNIDPNDPKAALKIVWNQFLAYWAGGNSYNKTLVAMLNPKGIERAIVADGWFNFLDGQSEKYRQVNPLNLQSQFLGVSLQPADLQGTASLSWRYREADKRDSVWAFIPALRRVRAVSPANRSDGYLGSDISGDDGFAFDGKPEDFEWKLVGQRDALRYVDPESVVTPVKIAAVPGGGWSTLTYANTPSTGFQVPGWSGISWAPAGLALAKRRFWVVEAIPRDKYYLYGRIELWVDAETWDGTWNRKFSWNGELINSYVLGARVNHRASEGDAGEWLPAATMAYACAENVKANRATVSGLRADPQAPFYRRVPLAPELFDSSALTRFGK